MYSVQQLPYLSERAVDDVELRELGNHCGCEISVVVRAVCPHTARCGMTRGPGVEAPYRQACNTGTDTYVPAMRGRAASRSLAEEGNMVSERVSSLAPSGFFFCPEASMSLASPVRHDRVLPRF